MNVPALLSSPRYYPSLKYVAHSNPLFIVPQLHLSPASHACISSATALLSPLYFNGRDILGSRQQAVTATTAGPLPHRVALTAPTTQDAPHPLPIWPTLSDIDQRACRGRDGRERSHRQPTPPPPRFPVMLRIGLPSQMACHKPVHCSTAASKRT